MNKKNLIVLPMILLMSLFITACGGSENSSDKNEITKNEDRTNDDLNESNSDSKSYENTNETNDKEDKASSANANQDKSTSIEHHNNKKEKSIDDFKGYYYKDDNETRVLYAVYEDKFVTLTSNLNQFTVYDIVEIIDSSADEINLKIHHDGHWYSGLSTEEYTREAGWQLIEDGDYLDINPTEGGDESLIRRMTVEEFKDSIPRERFKESIGESVDEFFERIEYGKNEH